MPLLLKRNHHLVYSGVGQWGGAPQVSTVRTIRCEVSSADIFWGVLHFSLDTNTCINNLCIRNNLSEYMPHLFIYLFLAVLGLRCCTRVFSSCGEWGLLFVAVRGLLIGVATLVAEHRS